MKKEGMLEANNLNELTDQYAKLYKNEKPKNLLMAIMVS